jgi:hypothetical protein
MVRQLTRLLGRYVFPMRYSFPNSCRETISIEAVLDLFGLAVHVLPNFGVSHRRMAAYLVRTV